MSRRIPENIIDEILSRTNIIEVISEYIPLKRAGRNFKAVCPFHHEKTPSFMISPDRQIYHCFGCGKGGNAFNFLMEYERLEFAEAVEVLAKKSGVVLPKDENPKTSSLISQLYRVNELAALFYAQYLNSSEGQYALRYLLNRGIQEETIKEFKIGYAPQKWDALSNYLRAKGVPLTLMEKAGLVLPKEDGGYYDRFRNRIIFPIIDTRARVLGFGARVLDNTLPKYINSPETPIYVKGRNLYGLYLAKDAIRQTDCVAIVEGYLDFIMPYQQGFKNIVASLGTAFTHEQAALLKRYTNNVIVVYDGDEAGEIAALRSLDIFIEEGINVKVVCLPQGLDPDSFVRKNSIAAFREMVDSAKGLFDYKLGILKSRYNIQEVESKAKVIGEMLLTINKFKNAIVKSEYIKRLAEELRVDENAVLQELNKVKADKPYTPSVPSPAGKILNVNPAEKLLVKLILEEAQLIHQLRNQIEPSDFQDKRISGIISLMFNLIDQGKSIEPRALINHLEGEDVLQFVCESSLTTDMAGQDRERAINDCIKRLKKERIKSRRQYLQDEIKNAQYSGNEERLKSLMQEFCNLAKQNT